MDLALVCGCRGGGSVAFRCSNPPTLPSSPNPGVCYGLVLPSTWEDGGAIAYLNSKIFDSQLVLSWRVE